MKGYEIIDAQDEHLEPIAQDIRQADVDECWAGGAMTVRDALKLSMISASVARTALINGVPAAIFGVTSLGCIWMLGTNVLNYHRKAILYYSKVEIEPLKKNFDVLYNFVDARHKHSIHWLNWLGFKSMGPMPHGPLGYPFYYFWRENNI